jgi:hypothetical protein
MMKKLHVLCLWQCVEGKDCLKYVVQGDQNVSVHLMINIRTVTSNVLSALRQSPDVY